jgi:hypothetical protein
VGVVIGRGSVMSSLVVVVIVIGGCAASSTGLRDAAGKGAVTGTAASCAALTVSQQFSGAALIFDGTVLAGPTVPGTGGVLASPARVRVEHYVKGSGPAVVSVDTGVAAAGGAVSATEDGIQPHAGERWQILTSSSSQPYETSLCAGSRPLPAGSGVLPVPEGAAWFSEAVDTSAPTVISNRPAGAAYLRKWLLWSGELFASEGRKGLGIGQGGYGWGDAEPGFGDWDALNVDTLPETPAEVMKLLRSGRLEAGQSDPAERTSPLIWLAQLAAMLADDPTTSTARVAAVTAIKGFPGIVRVGTVRDPRGRLGVAVAETASNLHPVSVATGPGCANPSGGAGCVGVGEPSGTYRTVLIYNAATDRPLALQTVAVMPIPSARIKAGTVVYQVSYIQAHVVLYPKIPPPPAPANRTVQSVPWHLARVSSRTITLNWSSGTCGGPVHPAARIDVTETSQTITVRVLVHVVTAGPGTLCAGVGLGGTLSTTLPDPVGGRRILHGPVTDQER